MNWLIDDANLQATAYQALARAIAELPNRRAAEAILFSLGAQLSLADAALRCEVELSSVYAGLREISKAIRDGVYARPANACGHSTREGA